MKLAFPGGWQPWALLVGVSFLFALVARGEIWKQRALRSAFAADSIAAAADTSRTFFKGELAVTLRRLIQVDIARDSLARELRTRPVLRVTGTVTIKELDTVLVGAVTDSGSVRVGKFATYSKPYAVAAVVGLPPPPADGFMRLHIELDTARFRLETHCGPRVNGVAPATMVFVSPAWLPFTIDTALVSPMSCNATVFQSRHGIGYYGVRTAGVVAGGYALFRFIKSLVEDQQ